MPIDVDPTTITSSTIAARVIISSRLLMMIVDADHVQIGRNIAAHDIVITRLLLIVRTCLTPIVSLK